MSSTGVARITGVDPSVAIKAPCKVATTANITLSGAQTVDGVALTETTPKTRVLVRSQTSSVNNGIYDVYDTAWRRSDDFNGSRDVVDGTLVTVESGTLYSGSTWRVNADNPISIGVSAIELIRTNNFDSAVMSVATFADLAATPMQAGQSVFVRGIGGGHFDSYSATVTSDGFYNSPSGTAGVALARRTVSANTRTLPDITALRLVEGAADGDIFEILEHTVGLGYGGGKFIVDSTLAQSDDDGVFIECVDTKLQRKFNGAVCTSFYGVDGTTDDYVKVQAAIAAAYALETSVCINRGNNMLAGSITISTDHLKIYFERGSYFTPTTDASAIIISADDIEICNPKIVTAGYGADSAGLIQITDANSIIIREPIIESDKAAANSRTRVYNGIATAICSDVRIYGGLITGTPKSGVHISTASRNVKCYGTTVKNTGNHATGTFGFTPGFDSGGYGDNGFFACRAEDTQGEFFFISAENHGTYGYQECLGNTIANCSGDTSGKGAIRTGTFNTGYYPKDLQISNNTFDIIGDSGLVIGAGTGYSNGNKFKTIQNAGLNITSDSETIEWTSESDSVENFSLVNSASQNGFLVGTAARVKIISPIIKHDLVGVTAGNIFAIGTISGKTCGYYRVLDPDFNAIAAAQYFRFLSTVTNGHIRYSGSGVPTNNGQFPGSMYARIDGSGVADNLYIRRSTPAWVGYA